MEDHCPPCSKSHCKLDKFRRDGKYCDIKIRTQNTTIMCHRSILASVSEFFDVRFQSKLLGNDEEEIFLPEMDPLVFESVLKFAYLGQVPNFLDPEIDVYEILKACDFLRIFDLAEFCISHIIEHVSLIENVCEIFRFSCISNYPILSKALSSYIAENLCLVSQNEDFLLMPYEQLNMVMKKYEELNDETACLSVIFRDDDLLLDTMIRWISQVQDRTKYFQHLVSIVNFEKVSENYIEFLSNEYKVKLDGCIDVKSCLNTFFTPEIKDGLPAVIYQNPSRNSALYVYVSFVNPSEVQGGILSLSKCHLNCQWSFVELESSFVELGSFEFLQHFLLYGSVEIVALDEPYNNLYCLDHYSIGGISSSFSSYSTVSFNEGQALTSPQLHFSEHSSRLCGFQNNSVYLYNFHSEASSNFLHYKCEVNEWFMVPKLETSMYHANMVTDNKLVYLIGVKKRLDSIYNYSGNVEDFSWQDFSERIENHAFRSPRYVLSYDNRIPKWQELTKLETSELCDPASCCYLNGKIYASDAMKIEVFDLVAGKWELLSNNNYRAENKYFSLRKMVPFENNLWIFYCTEEEETKLVIFNPMTTTWLPCPFFSLVSTAEDYEKKYLHQEVDCEDLTFHQPNGYRCSFVDTVVFNY